MEDRTYFKNVNRFNRIILRSSAIIGVKYGDKSQNIRIILSLPFAVLYSHACADDSICNVLTIFGVNTGDLRARCMYRRCE